MLLLFIYQYIAKSLPEIKDLKSFQVCLPPIRIYTQEGELIASRNTNDSQGFVKLDNIPPLLLKSFFAAEDHRFWEHKGVDFYALLRATFKIVKSGRKSQGGSTITMQVARNFYLKNRKKTFLRKLKEIILAQHLENRFNKKDILELYLNKIYMGNGSFGISSAAKLYLQKTLEQLTIDEMALLAALPQAPSLINPIVNPEATQRRRNFVLKRMYHLGYLDQKNYEYAIEKPVVMPSIGSSVNKNSIGSYISDLVQETVYKYFKRANDTEYYNVYTTLNAQMQRSADEAIKNSILDYDKRHAYRGPEKRLEPVMMDDLDYVLDVLQKMPIINGLIPSIVTECDQESITVILRSGIPVIISPEGSNWIIQNKENLITKHIQPGDILRVYYKDQKWCIGQIPEVQAALVAIDPRNGAIQALSGGFSYTLSPFNRAIYAFRQPGSVFKPFIYAAALEKGHTLADVFNDAPLVFEVPGKDIPWRPQNVNQSFQGLMRLRLAFAYSINSVTIRILQAIGFSYTLKYIEHFGFDTKQWPKNLSLALGTGEVTPLTMARAYAVFANGGYRVDPYLISHIINSQGKIIYQARPAWAPTNKVFQKQSESASNLPSAESSVKKAYAPRVISSEVAFLVNSALQDVTRYGTGQLAKKLGRLDIAGKTGTTNDRIDTWFIGYNDKVATSVWVGHDQPHSLQEYASSVALPLWLNFMQAILQDIPEEEFEKPPTIQTASIDAQSGKLVKEGTAGSILEYFQQDQLKKMMPTQTTKSAYSAFRKQKALVETEPLF